MVAMLEQVAIVFVRALYLYSALGILFAIAFVLVGVKKIDPEATGTSWGFRLLIFPASVAFWPLLLRRWLSGSRVPPEERNPHR
jgi:hypothetical protein